MCRFFLLGHPLLSTPATPFRPFHPLLRLVTASSPLLRLTHPHPSFHNLSVSFPFSLTSYNSLVKPPHYPTLSHTPVLIPSYHPCRESRSCSLCVCGRVWPAGLPLCVFVCILASAATAATPFPAPFAAVPIPILGSRFLGPAHGQSEPERARRRRRFYKLR